MKIHLRAALVAADGDVDRAARMLGLTPDDAARLLAGEAVSPPRPGQMSGTYAKVTSDDGGDERAWTDDDDDKPESA